jgi:uncharacterized protein YjbI with pentapeptide repeats
MNWINVLQAIISGAVVGLVVFGLDLIRAWRERKLSDFRIAANWETSSPKVSLRSFYLRGANLSGLNLSEANLESANMQDAGLWATDLTNANLRNANLSRTELIGTNFKQCNAYGANFAHSTIRRHKFPDLDCVTDFSGTVLVKCNFRKATVEQAVFHKADLRLSNFNEATLTNCDFTGADLTGSKWEKVKRAENCIWKNVKIDATGNFPIILWKEIQNQNAKPRKKRKNEK